MFSRLTDLWDDIDFYDFTGGENRSAVQERVAQNELMTALNLTLADDLTLETRKGKTKMNVDSLGAGGIKSVFRFATPDGTKFLAVEHGTNFYCIEWNGYDTFTGFGSPVRTDLDSESRLSGCQWKGVLLLTNGEQDIFSFDGTTCTNIGAPIKSKIVKVYGNRLWAVDTANPNHLWCSKTEDYSDWTVSSGTSSAALIYIRDNDGDEILDLMPLLDGMIILKRRSAWPLTGTSKETFRVGVSPLTDNVGAVSRYASVVRGSQGLFLGQDNVYYADLSGVTPISNTHRDFISRSANENSIAQFTDNGRRVVFGLDTVNQLCVEIESGKGQIFSWGALSPASFGLTGAEGDDGVLLIGDADTGDLYKLSNDSTDNGEPIKTVFVSSRMDYGSKKDKILRRIQPEIVGLNEEPGVVFIGYDIDRGKFANTEVLLYADPETLDFGDDDWGDVKWGEAVLLDRPVYIHGAQGKAITVMMTTSIRVKIFGYSVRVQTTGAR